MKQITPLGSDSAPDPDRNGQRPGRRPPPEVPPGFDIDAVFMSEDALGSAPPDLDLRIDASEDPWPSIAGMPLLTDASPHAIVAGVPEDTNETETAVSIAELMEATAPIDWREAVAIARRICDRIAQHPAAGTQEHLLDPRHIEITETGEVPVLPGAPGGDPFVKQVGRILRALIQGAGAPVQLRLIAAQAAFEFPGFGSVQELSNALSSFETPDDIDSIRKAFKRGCEAKFSVPADYTRRPGLPVAAHTAAADKPTTKQVGWERVAAQRRHRAAAAVALVLVTVAVTWWMSAPGASEVRTVAQTITASGSAETLNGAATLPVEAPVTPAVVDVAPVGAPSVDAAPVSTAPVGLNPVVPSPPPSPPTSAPAPRGSEPVQPVPGPARRASARQLRVPRTPEPAATASAPPAIAGAPARSETPPPTSEPARIVQPDAFLLPAFRHYRQAQAALDAGDHDKALLEAAEALRVLNDVDVAITPIELRDAVRQLFARADEIRMREEERVYTSGDEGVTPPVALRRQLPSLPPGGRANAAAGTLEMLISRDGDVETLRLHTPENRFHERMIVSAAKTWRYRPAMKNGKPVRFLLTSTITLP